MSDSLVLSLDKQNGDIGKGFTCTVKGKRFDTKFEIILEVAEDVFSMSFLHLLVDIYLSLWISMEVVKILSCRDATTVYQLEI